MKAIEINANKTMSPVIVVGMRSGTSVIARILQENIGIMMDEGPIKKDWRNPNGYYEDHKLQRINRIATSYRMRQVGTNKKRTVPIEWATRLISWSGYRESKYLGSWGFKDPQCIGLLRYMHQFFANPRWIVPLRSFDQMVKSQVKNLSMPKPVAIASVQSFLHIVKRELTGKCIMLDMRRQRSEKDLTQTLNKVLFPRGR